MRVGEMMAATKWMLKIQERMAQGAVRQSPDTFEVRVIGPVGRTPIPDVGDMVPGDFTGSGGIGFVVLTAVVSDAGLAPGQAGWSGSVAPLLVSRDDPPG